MIADSIVDGAPLRLHRIRKAHRADMRFPQRDQRIVVHRRAKIGRYRIRDHVARFALRAEIPAGVFIQRQQLRARKILDTIPWSANHGKSYNDFLVILEK